MTQPVVGQCQFCGCTAKNPCLDYAQNECGWANKRQDVCTTQKCMARASAAKAAEMRARREFRREHVQPIAERVWAARRLGQGKRSKQKNSKARAA